MCVTNTYRDKMFMSEMREVRIGVLKGKRRNTNSASYLMAEKIIQKIISPLPPILASI